jgi:hypothetical protein
MNEPMLNYMLPVLLSKINSESADIRFLSLKIFTDIVIQYINEDSVYDVKMGFDPSDHNKSTTKQINDLILGHLFPNFSIILADSDPVPLFGLKLLSAIVERNPLFVQLFKQYQLVSTIVENFQVGHSRLNRHTINILKSMIESKELSFTEIY